MSEYRTCMNAENYNNQAYVSKQSFNYETFSNRGEYKQNE